MYETVGEDVDKLKSLCTVDGNVKWCSHRRKQYGISLKLKTELPYEPAISLLGMYPKELKMGSQRDIGIPMYTEALFTIARR